jgi:predicted RNA binding protein YcfA (HicA-like mRNA interferase family)
MRIGWQIKRQAGSHKTLERPNSLISSLPSMMATKSVQKMLGRIAKHTGLTPDNL